MVLFCYHCLLYVIKNTSTVHHFISCTYLSPGEGQNLSYRDNSWTKARGWSNVVFFLFCPKHIWVSNVNDVSTVVDTEEDFVFRCQTVFLFSRHSTIWSFGILSFKENMKRRDLLAKRNLSSQHRQCLPHSGHSHSRWSPV